MSKQTERPDFVTQEHLEYLDELRESGVTNMFGAAPYLEREFPKLAKGARGSFRSSEKAQAVLSYWMETFTERHGIKKPSA